MLRQFRMRPGSPQSLRTPHRGSGRLALGNHPPTTGTVFRRVYSTVPQPRKSQRIISTVQLAARGTLWNLHPCSARCRSIWLCALAILNLHPGVTPPHRHEEQGCRQGSQLLHSWFESCSNTCGIVGQKFVRLNMTQNAQSGFNRARVASCRDFAVPCRRQGSGSAVCQDDNAFPGLITARLVAPRRHKSRREKTQ